MGGALRLIQDSQKNCFGSGMRLAIMLWLIASLHGSALCRHDFNLTTTCTLASYVVSMETIRLVSSIVSNIFQAARPLHII